MAAPTLYFMGLGHIPEVFRCRVYGCEETPEDRQRAAFVETLAADGVLECEAYDRWIAALSERGWVESEFVPHPEVKGARAKLWKLNAFGRSEWARIKAGA